MNKNCKLQRIISFLLVFSLVIITMTTMTKPVYAGAMTNNNVYRNTDYSRDRMHDRDDNFSKEFSSSFGKTLGEAAGWIVTAGIICVGVTVIAPATAPLVCSTEAGVEASGWIIGKLKRLATP